MAKRRKKVSNKKIKELVATLISVIILIVSVLIVNQNKENNLKISEEKYESGTKIIVGDKEKQESENDLHVYYIDVGQADSILITNNNQSCLIDAGNNQDGEKVVNFIKSKGISKIDYVIGTHPHEDHIGGLDNVINNFEIGKVFLPDIQTNTKTFEDVLIAIEKNDYKIYSLETKDIFNVGKAEFEVKTNSILDKNNLNLSSNIIKMEFNDVKFLFTGDAETENEKLISNWEQIDFLKVAHHGSSTSTSDKFIKQIKPEYAIISVGKNNDYGHPNENVLKKLEEINSQIYRTDKNGTIEVIVK